VDVKTLFVNLLFDFTPHTMLFKRATPSASHQRFHPILVRAVVVALERIFIDQQYADKVIGSVLQSNPKAGSRDRAFIAETTYDVVRYYRLFTEILGRTPKKESDFWEITAIYFLTRHLRHPEEEPVELPEWKELRNVKPEHVLAKYQMVSAQRAVRESIPDWIDERCAAELGDKWEPTLHQLNRPAEVVLRTNRLKTTRDALQKALAEEGIETRAVGDTDALCLTIRKNVFITKAFRAGMFEVQDFSSQAVAPLLDPKPGMRVVDACAGGGGKTLHLAALMQSKGQLIALDTLAWKLDELKLRARRAGVSNIENRPIENRKVIKRLYNTADRLLLDVPCSGLGVLRRNPDSKWKLTSEQIDQLLLTQQDILQSYSPIVKPGGRMVYATCSILPSENRQQVDTFLQSEAGKEWTLLSDRSILPQDQGFDGFYMALLERKA
jgi:16S rRNA (cytosine967-C5)-methyltransferase